MHENNRRVDHTYEVNDQVIVTKPGINEKCPCHKMTHTQLYEHMTMILSVSRKAQLRNV